MKKEQMTNLKSTMMILLSPPNSEAADKDKNLQNQLSLQHANFTLAATITQKLPRSTQCLRVGKYLTERVTWKAYRKEQTKDSREVFRPWKL